jgi:hypothetical protein
MAPPPGLAQAAMAWTRGSSAATSVTQVSSASTETSMAGSSAVRCGEVMESTNSVIAGRPYSLALSA